MATSGTHDKVESLTKWPMEYVDETKECICGQCGQVLIPGHSAEEIAIHFKTCKNAKEKGLLMVKTTLIYLVTEKVFKELRRINHKFEGFKAEADLMKTEFEKEIVDLKSEIKKVSEMKGGEARDAERSDLSNRESVMAHEVKMEEVDEGGSEETFVGAEGTSVDSNEPVQAKNEAEKANDEAFPELETGKRKDKNTKSEASKEPVKKKQKKEPTQSEQATIPMNCFNLATRNHLFTPSLKWTIGGISHLLKQTSLELTSDEFQWSEYPVRARAKFQLKKNNRVFMSLLLKNESELKEFSPIPQVFYSLKDPTARNPRHLCKSSSFSGGLFGSSFAYDADLAHKSTLNRSPFNVDDAVEIEIYAEPPRTTQQVQSFNGTLLWIMDKYKSRLQLEREGLVSHQESPYFYTGRRGYRVQVRMSLDGDENGGGPTVIVWFRSGEFDAELHKSFLHSTTVTLLNQKCCKPIIVRKVTTDMKNKIEYRFNMGDAEEVEKVIENDTLYCRVLVKAL